MGCIFHGKLPGRVVAACVINAASESCYPFVCLMCVTHLGCIPRSRLADPDASLTHAGPLICAASFAQALKVCLMKTDTVSSNQDYRYALHNAPFGTDIELLLGVPRCATQLPSARLASLAIPVARWVSSFFYAAC